MERYKPLKTYGEIHYDFIKTTDVKNLRAQLNKFVAKGLEGAHDELVKRRQVLKRLLDCEDKIYEKEFSDKVKSRIDEGIQARKDVLYRIKEESTKKQKDYLQKKRIEQYMNSCYEVREMLRNKETKNVKETQIEQMMEKERAIKHEQDINKYWLSVGKINDERDKEQQFQENCLKQQLSANFKRVLDIQLQEHEEKRQKELEIKKSEEKRIADLLNELRLEKFDRERRVQSDKIKKYREELQNMMAADELKRKQEREQAAAEHRQLIKEVQAEEQAEILARKQRRIEAEKALCDFISYIRKMREYEKEQRKIINDRLEDVGRVDLCTKNNLKQIALKRAEKAQECYCVLRKQMCEAAERKLREEAERRENKMLINWFAHADETKEQRIERANKYREELDKQIEDIKRWRIEEEEKYHKFLLRATTDPEMCEELAAQYLQEGIDYLKPHPNWRIFFCPEEAFPSYIKRPNLVKPIEKGKYTKCEPCLDCEHKNTYYCTYRG